MVVPRASSVNGADARFAEAEFQKMFDPHRCEDMRDDEGGRQRDMSFGKFKPTLRVFVSWSPHLRKT